MKLCCACQSLARQGLRATACKNDPEGFCLWLLRPLETIDSNVLDVVINGDAGIRRNSERSDKTDAEADAEIERYIPTEMDKREARIWNAVLDPESELPF